MPRAGGPFQRAFTRDQPEDITMLRRQFLAILSALFFIALAPAFAEDSPQAVVEGYLAGWNAHDAAKAASYFADDVVYYDASYGKPMNGKDAAKAVIDGFLAAVPDAKWTMKGTPIIQDGRVAFEWEFSGTNSGAWPDGAPASNKTFSFPGVSVFEIKAGKISTQSDYYDALGFYKQIGLM
jgi:steroid delta-isomerase-like uncharacterized protein